MPIARAETTANAGVPKHASAMAIGPDPRRAVVLRVMANGERAMAEDAMAHAHTLGGR